MPVDSFSEGRYRESWVALVDTQRAFESCMRTSSQELEQAAVLLEMVKEFGDRLCDFLAYESAQIEKWKAAEAERRQQLEKVA